MNNDELVGYILRKLYEVHDVSLMYNEVKSVLEEQSNFLAEHSIGNNINISEEYENLNEKKVNYLNKT